MRRGEQLEIPGIPMEAVSRLDDPQQADAAMHDVGLTGATLDALRVRLVDAAH